MEWMLYVYPDDFGHKESFGEPEYSTKMATQVLKC